MKLAEKIISLAPTHTESLFFLGLESRIIGITENCDYPPRARRKETFGSWAYPDVQKIIRAKADLVCTFGKHQEQIAALLMEYGINVFHSDPPTVEDALSDIKNLGDISGAKNRHNRIKTLYDRLNNVEARLNGLCSKPSVMRIMNWDPLITIGPGTFQFDAVIKAGGENITKSFTKPYFPISISRVNELNPKVIFFCEHGLTQKIYADPAWKNINAVISKKVFHFPCGLTCRSGPRIVDMVERLAHSIHPERFNR